MLKRGFWGKDVDSWLLVRWTISWLQKKGEGEGGG